MNVFAKDPSRRVFWLLTASLLLFALLHSMWATSLDGFTIDEPYHVAAGATYLRFHDYRVNPEHPPLVKLAAGLAATPSVLHLKPLSIFDGKRDERRYTQTAVFLDSDGAWVQRRARTALFTFNLALLLLLTVLVRRLLGGWIALAMLLLLALDPTVSAHLPVVMTDLPMALLGLSCCCMMVLVLRTGAWLDWVYLGLLTGAFLATKHSAPTILLPLLILCVLGLIWRIRNGSWPTNRIAGLVLALSLCITVLWSTYGFHYYESPSHQETFNRTLDLKIEDLHSPFLKQSLALASRYHLAPRAYLWGMADTLRAGVEGRPIWITAFAHSWEGKSTPAWVPTADLFVKLPIGFIVLFFLGAALWIKGPTDQRTKGSLALLAAIGLTFLIFISLNKVFYAGLRHWLFLVPLMSLFAALFLVESMRQKKWMRYTSIACLALIAISVLPQRRIWGYHNELVGGSNNAWRYFDNESVDLGQRSPDVIAFYKTNIAPQPIFLEYYLLEEMGDANHVQVARPAPEEVADGHLRGWFAVQGNFAAARRWLHSEAFRDAKPAAQFGSLLIYHGDFYMPTNASLILAMEGFRQFSKPDGDKKRAELLFRKSASMEGKCVSVCVLLGNITLERKEIPESLRWYQRAVEDADDPTTKADVSAQMNRVRNRSLQPMRPPNEE